MEIQFYNLNAKIIQMCPFSDAINSSIHRNSIVLDSDDSLHQLTNKKVIKYDDKLKPSGISDNFNTRHYQKHAPTKLLKKAKPGLRPKINIEVEKENIDGNRDNGINSNSKACRDQEYRISQEVRCVSLSCNLHPCRILILFYNLSCSRMIFYLDSCL